MGGACHLLQAIAQGLDSRHSVCNDLNALCVCACVLALCVFGCLSIQAVPLVQWRLAIFSELTILYLMCLVFRVGGCLVCLALVDIMEKHFVPL